jgi:hypothetical protein
MVGTFPVIDPKVIQFTANKHLKLVRDYAVLLALRQRVANLEKIVGIARPPSQKKERKSSRPRRARSSRT